MTDPLAPLRHELTLRCGPVRAFDAFTTRMGEWWDPAYTPDPGSFTGIEVVPTRENAAYRHKYGDWPHLLGRYAASA